MLREERAHRSLRRRRAALKLCRQQGRDMGHTVHHGEHFIRLDLSRTKLDSCEFVACRFVGVNLSRSCLCGARFIDCTFQSSSLAESEVSESVWIGCQVLDCDLSGTLFEAAYFGSCRFVNSLRESSQWQGAQFDACQFQGERIALLRAHGAKLTGCLDIRGVAIAASDPVVFVSYSREDSHQIDSIVQHVSRSGFRVWIDRSSISGGLPVLPAIAAGVRSADAVVVFLSPAARAGAWVAEELRLARREEVRRNRHILLPVALAPMAALQGWSVPDLTTSEDVAHVLLGRHCVDGWHDGCGNLAGATAQAVVDGLRLLLER